MNMNNPVNFTFAVNSALQVAHSATLERIKDVKTLLLDYDKCGVRAPHVGAAKTYGHLEVIRDATAVTHNRVFDDRSKLLHTMKHLVDEGTSRWYTFLCSSHI